MTSHATKIIPQEVLEGTICHCFGITYGVIREAVRENHFKGIEQVTRYCQAGGGCRGCMADIRQVIDVTRHEFGLDQIEREKYEARKSRSDMPVIKRIRLIEACLQGEVKVMLQGDAVEARLVHIEGDRVEIRLVGDGADELYGPWLGKIQELLRKQVDAYLDVQPAKR